MKNEQLVQTPSFLFFIRRPKGKRASQQSLSMKKFLLLLCLMLCTAFPGRSADYNEGTVTVDGIVYEVGRSFGAGGTSLYAKVLSASQSLAGDIELPQSVYGNERDYPVTVLSGGAFAGCSEVTSIMIPSRVTSVGYAGEGCTELGEFRVSDDNKTFRAVDGILMTTGGQIVMFPPKHRAKYRRTTTPSIYGKSTFGYCSIDSLFISRNVGFSNTYGNAAFKGFKGNIILRAPTRIINSLRGLTTHPLSL